MNSREPLELNLFGPPRLSRAGEPLAPPSPKPLALLAYLALHPEGSSREVLAELLWEPGKLQNVRQALYSLRALPGGADWLTSGPPVALHAESDVARFERALRAGDYAEALAVWDRSEHDQPLLHSLELADAPAFEDWLDEERTRLHERYLDALRAHIVELTAAGDHAGAARHAETLIRLDPLGEEGYRAAMRAELAQNRRERAIQVFERCRRVLRDELGAEPEPATLDLLREVEGESATRGKRALLLTEVDDVPARPHVLYGREADLAACRAGLAEGGRLLVQGLGGMGKSALAATLAAEHVEAGGRALWLELGDDSPEAAFDALAAPFDARQQVAKGDPAARAAALAGVLTENGVTLLVLDDVWNAHTLSRVAEALPGGLSLLATSRQRYAELPLYSLDRLARADALALLRHHAPEVGEYDARADAVCALLGDHPFAVRLAGNTLRERLMEISTILDLLGNVTAHSSNEFNLSLDGLITLSLEKLSDQAYEICTSAGSVMAPQFNLKLIQILTRRSQDELVTALIELSEAGILNFIGDGRSAVYKLHDITFAYLKMKSSVRYNSFVGSIKLYLEDSLSSPDDVEIIMPNISKLLQNPGLLRREDLIAILNIFFNLSNYSEFFGVNINLIQSTRDLLSEYRLEYMTDEITDIYGKLGNLYANQIGDFESAFNCFWASYQSDKLKRGKHFYPLRASSTAVMGWHVGKDSKFVEKLFFEAEQAAVLSSKDSDVLAVYDHMLHFYLLCQDYEPGLVVANKIVSFFRKIDESGATIDASLVFYSNINLSYLFMMMDEYESSSSSLQKSMNISIINRNPIWQAIAKRQSGELNLKRCNIEAGISDLYTALDIFTQNGFKREIEEINGILSRV